MNSWQLDVCEGCLWEDTCTENEESWMTTSLNEEERCECKHYCLTGENIWSQYAEDLVMRQEHYDRSSEESMGFVDIESQRELTRVLREYGL